MTLIPLDRKQLILEDAKERILKNHTLEQIAKTHGITKRTLNTWLMSLGDEYQELRQLCIDNMLAEALEEIDNATDNFPRARELKMESCYLVCRKKRSTTVWC
jgi:transposase-like protein